METKKARYHITITDNETGKIEHDADACVIICACKEGDGVANLVAVDAGALSFAEVFADMLRTMKNITKSHPEIPLIAAGLTSHPADEETPTEETGGADCE